MRNGKNREDISDICIKTGSRALANIALFWHYTSCLQAKIKHFGRLQIVASVIIPYVTTPATPTNSANQSGFFMPIIYNKPALSVDQQIHLLESRGLSVPDKNKACHYLQFIKSTRMGFSANWQHDSFWGVNAE